MIYLIAGIGILAAVLGVWGRWQQHSADAAKAELKVAVIARDTAVAANKTLAASIGETKSQCSAALATLAAAEKAAQDKAAAAARAKAEADRRLAGQRAALEEWQRIARDSATAVDNCALAKEVMSKVPR